MAAVVQSAEAAAAKLPAEARPDFRTAADQDWIFALLGELHSIPGRELKQRFAEALLTLEHAEADDVTTRDMYRGLVIDRYVKLGKIPEARALARQVVEPDALTRLLVAKRYDSLFDGPSDHRKLLQASLQSYDDATRRYLEAAPDDPQRMLSRGQALRALGREDDAVKLLLPFASDLKRVEAGGEKAFWIVNEAALALSALGRHAEAVGLMEKLLTLDLQKHPALVSMAINHGEVLNSAGRYAEAAAHETKLAEVGKVASPFGHMWIWSLAACAHLHGGDTAAARPWLEKLATNSAKNEAAHMRALLCANDMAGAEKLLIARLKGDQGVAVLLSLQTFELGTMQSTSGKLIEARMMALRERPAVRDAVAASGRILSLPLAKTY
jgi:tetratricopeptide (TPR) repeat protein